ncbi:hypothetical protein U1Q18_040570, partial [Sarracenia purpurea var. burkii]
EIEGTEGAQSAPFEPLDTKKRGVDLSSGKGGEPSSPPSLEAPAPKEDDFPPLQAITDPKSVYPEIAEDEQEGKEALVPDTDNGEDHTDVSSDVSEEMNKGFSQESLKRRKTLFEKMALDALDKAKQGRSPLNKEDLEAVTEWLAWYRGSPVSVVAEKVEALAAPIQVSSVMFPDLNCDGKDVLKENSCSAGEGIQAAPIREPCCQAHQVLEKMPEPRSADQGVAIPGERCHHVGEVPAHLVGSFSETACEASGLVLCGNQFGPPPEYEKEGVLPPRVHSSVAEAAQVGVSGDANESKGEGDVLKDPVENSSDQDVAVLEGKDSVEVEEVDGESSGEEESSEKDDSEMIAVETCTEEGEKGFSDAALLAQVSSSAVVDIVCSVIANESNE